MTFPYDNATRYLQSLRPQDWPTFLGVKTDAVELCQTDLSTIASRSDMMFLLHAGKSEAMHIENQATYDAHVGERVLMYSVLGRKLHNVPVRSFVLLLRPEADGPAMTGVVKQCYLDGTPYLDFHYTVVRIWKRSPEELFQSGLSVLPLAFIADIKQEALPDLVRRTQQRLEGETVPTAAGVWTAIGLLLGLRYEKRLVKGLLKGVSAMRESVIFQDILEEGEAKGKLEEARTILTRLGSRRFGNPDAKTLAALNGITSVERLEELLDRLVIVSNWNDLFGI